MVQPPPEAPLGGQGRRGRAHPRGQGLREQMLAGKKIEPQRLAHPGGIQVPQQARPIQAGGLGLGAPAGEFEQLAQ